MLSPRHILVAAFLVVLAVQAGCNKNGPGPPPPPPIPIPGFVALPAPRSNLPIGSIWKEGMGPEKSEVAESLLVFNSSYGSMETEEFRKNAAGFALSLKRLLNVSAGGQRVTSDTLVLDSVKVVSIRSVRDIDAAERQSFISDGILVAGLRYHYLNGDTIGVRAALDTLKKGTVSIDIGANGRRTVTLRGGRLYVAFRVLRFGAFRESTIASYDANGESRFRVGTRYTVECGRPQKERPSDQCTESRWKQPGESCAVGIRVRDGARAAACYFYESVACDDGEWSGGSTRTRTAPVTRGLDLASSRLSDFGYESDEIELRGVTFEIVHGAVTATGPLKHLRRILPADAVPNPRAPGWTQ